MQKYYFLLSHYSVIHHFSILFKWWLVICLNVVYFEIFFNDWIIYSLFQISFQERYMLLGPNLDISCICWSDADPFVLLKVDIPAKNGNSKYYEGVHFLIFMLIQFSNISFSGITQLIRLISRITLTGCLFLFNE